MIGNWIVHIYFLLHCSEHKIIKLLDFSNMVGHGGFSNHFIQKTFRKFHVLCSQFVIIHEKYLKKKCCKNNHWDEVIKSREREVEN